MVDYFCSVSQHLKYMYIFAKRKKKKKERKKHSPRCLKCTQMYRGMRVSERIWL